jgi:hypothetical protein
MGCNVEGEQWTRQSPKGGIGIPAFFLKRNILLYHMIHQPALDQANA